MKRLTLLLALVVAAGSCHASDGPIRVTIDGPHDPGLEESFRHDVAGGWRLLADAVGDPGEPPPVVYVSHGAHVILVMSDAQAPRRDVATCWTRRTRGSGYVCCWYPRFYGGDATSRARVMAHEFGHLFFHLPDQYSFDAWGRPAPQGHNCIMGNFHAFGWSGTLCPPCTEKAR